jgi:hypothetical protein
MRLGLLGRDLPAAHELPDERVVLGELAELAVAVEVRPRIADVPEPDDPVLDQRDRHRRAHPRRLGVVRLALVDAAVRLLDQRDDEALARGVVVRLLAKRLDGEAGRDLAGVCAAHSVRDGEERRRDDERVLVVPALPPGVRHPGVAAEIHASNWKSVCPTRTMSPRASLRGRSSWIPFT